MADTICHATQGGLVMLAPFIARIRRRRWLWTLAGAGAFFGALPDIVGAYGNVVRHDHWRLYVSAHAGPLGEILRYVPMYWLHLFVDSFTHGPGRRWWVWDERLWVEVTLWMVNAAIIVLYVMIWRRTNRSPHEVQAPDAGHAQ
jgi:hypothetical protein